MYKATRRYLEGIQLVADLHFFFHTHGKKLPNLGSNSWFPFQAHHNHSCLLLSEFALHWNKNEALFVCRLPFNLLSLSQNKHFYKLLSLDLYRIVLCTFLHKQVCSIRLSRNNCLGVARIVTPHVGHWTSVLRAARSVRTSSFMSLDGETMSSIPG